MNARYPQLGGGPDGYVARCAIRPFVGFDPAWTFKAWCEADREFETIGQDDVAPVSFLTIHGGSE
jgi:hypothetical protein